MNRPWLFILVFLFNFENSWSWGQLVESCQLRGETEIDAGYGVSTAGKILVFNDDFYVTDFQGNVIKYKVVDDANCILEHDWTWEDNGRFLPGNGASDILMDSQGDILFKLSGGGLSRLDGEIDDCYFESEIAVEDHIYWFYKSSFNQVPLSVRDCEDEKKKFSASGVKSVFAVDNKMIYGIMFNSLGGAPTYLNSFKIEKDKLQSIYRTPITSFKSNAEYLCSATKVIVARGYVVVLDSKCAKLVLYRENGGFARVYQLSSMFKDQNKSSKRSIIDIQHLNGMGFIISVREGREIKLYRIKF